MRWRRRPRPRRGGRSPISSTPTARPGSGSGSIRSTAPENEKDLAAILPAHPDGIVLPKAEGGASVAELARRLTERGNATAQILAIATETPAAIFQLGTYGGAQAARRPDLGRGGSARGDRRGDVAARRTGASRRPTSSPARSACSARRRPGWRRSRPSIRPFKDLDGLAAYAARARRDGFTGMMAIHPDQVRGDQRRLHAERGGDRACPRGGRGVRGQSRRRRAVARRADDRPAASASRRSASSPQSE